MALRCCRAPKCLPFTSATLIDASMEPADSDTPQNTLHSGKASVPWVPLQADLGETGRTLRRVGKSLEAEEARLKQAAEAAAAREAAAATAAAELAAAQQRAQEKEAALERLHADVWSKVNCWLLCDVVTRHV
jgi:hypothetical protein